MLIGGGFLPSYLPNPSYAPVYSTDCPEETTHGEFTTMVKSTLERAYDIVREKTGMQQERQKEYYDRKCMGNLSLSGTTYGFTPL